MDLGALLAALARRQMAYVITGSVAARAHGVALDPGDLDIAPDLTPENLARLSGLLREWAAKPRHEPAWKHGLDAEACERWTPEPATEANLDHRFVTPHGEFDVVPRGAGMYEALAPRATPMVLHGTPVLVAHLDDLIALAEKWDRETDRRRLPLLRAARPVIETPRLRLRRFNRDDADALFEVFADPDARRFYPEMEDRSAVEGWIRKNLLRYDEHGFGLWAMIEKESGRLVGDSGLSYQDVEGVPELEVGYHVLAAERRKGYATEAARACLDHGFRSTAATVIGSIVSPANDASRAVAARVHANVREFMRPNGMRLFYFTRRQEWEGAS